MELGACMAVSSGQGINIWKAPWIPSIKLFKPSPNPNLVDLPDFEVMDLLNEGGRSWNVSLLTDLFDSNSVQHIQNIHLSQEVSSDRWTWAAFSKGLFSVRSAHELASQDLASRSSPLSPEDWSCPWGLKLQHRLKHLLWKMVWNILHVRASLARFVNSIDPDPWCCPFCKSPQ